MKICIVSDAWFPQVNGVVRTLDTTRRELLKLGHEVLMITPDLFRTMPMPTYPEIRLAVLPRRRLRAMIAGFAPDAVHIATEGPLGWTARRICLKADLSFTIGLLPAPNAHIASQRGRCPSSLIALGAGKHLHHIPNRRRTG